MLQPGNKGESGIIKAKPPPLLDGTFRDHYNNPLNSGQAFRFAKLQYRLFLDPEHNTPSIALPTWLPDTEPEKPTSVPHLTYRAVGVVSDQVPPKESKKGEMTIRAGKPAYLRITSGSSVASYQIVDSDKTFIEPKYVHFLQEYYQESTAIVNRTTLRELAEELSEAHIHALAAARLDWQHRWDTWAENRKRWEFEFIMNAAAIERREQGGPEPANVRWPLGTSWKDVVGKAIEDIIGVYDVGYAIARTASMYKHVPVYYEALLDRNSELRPDHDTLNLGGKAVPLSVHQSEATASNATGAPTLHELRRSRKLAPGPEDPESDSSDGSSTEPANYTNNSTKDDNNDGDNEGGNDEDEGA